MDTYSCLLLLRLFYVKNRIEFKGKEQDFSEVHTVYTWV